MRTKGTEFLSGVTECSETECEVAQVCENTKSHETVPFRRDNCMLCAVNLNKVVKRNTHLTKLFKEFKITDNTELNTTLLSINNSHSL